MPGVVLDLCSSCRGLWFDRGELAKVDDTPLELVPASPASGTPRTCPRCPGRVLESKAAQGADALVVDHCDLCRGMFLESGCLRRVQKLRVHRRRQAEVVDARLRRELAVRARERSEARDALPVPFEVSEPSDFLAFLLDLPVEEFDGTERTPWATWGLAGFIGLVWLWQLATPMEQWMAYAAVPGQILEGVGRWTALTAVFLHGGWEHVIGNLYFFWLFANNVEDRVGSLAFLAWYLVWGLAASIASVYMCSVAALDHPHLGASGAISGVMGAYLFLCPGQRLEVPIIRFAFWNYVLKMPAWAYLVPWIAMQLLCAARELPGVGWWAHIGGFAAGALVGLGYRIVADTSDESRLPLAA